MTRPRRLAVVLLAVLGLSLALTGPASAETGGKVDWSSYYGATTGPLLNDNLYIIDKTDSRFPVATTASEWNIRTDAVVLYRWGGPNGDQYDCTRVHCAFIDSTNEGATGWRVRVVTANYDNQKYRLVVISINTYYAWDNNGTVSKSGACQAVGKGLGLDYTRPAADYKSCMSSAMRWTIGSALDDQYVNELW